jgi:hypothetical protein
MVGMISPGMKHHEVTTVNAMRAYKDRPVLLMYSEEDKISSREAPILASFARMSVGPRNLAVVVLPRGRGTAMLRGPALVKVVDWIENPLQPEIIVASGTIAGVDGSTAPASSSIEISTGDAGAAEDQGTVLEE